jgi:hypothetical protein
MPTHNFNIEGSSPATVDVRAKIQEKSFIILVLADSTVVEHLPHNVKIECSNPATGTREWQGLSFALVAQW